MVITNFDNFTFRKIIHFYFTVIFQFISKVKLSNIVLLIKCNCNNTRGYPFWLYLSFSWEKNSYCDKFRQNVLPFHNQWKVWTRSVRSILRLGRPQLVRNCTIVNCINCCLDIVYKRDIWVVMLWWIIRSYPYPQNRGILEVATFFDTL